LKELKLCEREESKAIDKENDYIIKMIVPSWYTPRELRKGSKKVNPGI